MTIYAVVTSGGTIGSLSQFDTKSSVLGQPVQFLKDAPPQQVSKVDNADLTFYGQTITGHVDVPLFKGQSITLSSPTKVWENGSLNANWFGGGVPYPETFTFTVKANDVILATGSGTFFDVGIPQTFVIDTLTTLSVGTYNFVVSMDTNPGAVFAVGFRIFSLILPQ